MKKLVLGCVLSMMYSASAQARVAFVDPSGNIIDTPTQVESVPAAEQPIADVAVGVSEMVAPAAPFYETPLVIGAAIFAVLVIGFVLFLKRRK